MFTKTFATFALVLSVAAGPIQAVARSEVSARDLSPLFPAPNNVNVAEAAAACGQNLTLSCCDDVDLSQDVNDHVSSFLGLGLDNLLSDVGLFGKCNEISIPVVNLVPVNNILNNKCKQNVACCQNSDVEQSGLVNAGLPCIALSNLLA